MLPFFTFSQVDTVARYYTFGGSNNDIAEDIKGTIDGGYIVIGSTSSNSRGNTDGYLIKVDSNCTYQWSKALGGANNDWGYSIQQTFDKGFIVALSSNSYGNGGYDAVLMKRDSLGNHQWTKSYGGNDWDFAYDVVQTYDSGYVFCGETYNNTQGFSDIWIVKTNKSGDTLWTSTQGGSLIDKGNSLIETSDSNIVVAGITNTITDSTQVYVLKFSNTGTLLWDSIYGDSLYDDANNIIEANNGDYVMTGSTTSYNTNDDLDYYMVRINNNGNLIWKNFAGGPAPEVAYDLFETPTGDFFNTGYTEVSGGGMKDVILFKISSSGWWQGLGPTYGEFADDVAHAVTIGKDGDVCMAGYTESYGNGIKDVFLVRLDTIILNPDVAVNNYMDTIPLNVNNVYYEKNTYFIYPNPVNDILNVVYNHPESSLGEVKIYNSIGLIALNQKIKKGINTLDVVNLNSGIYFIEIDDLKGQLKRQKIIIK